MANHSNLHGATAWKAMWPIILGLLVLFIPTYKSLATTLWLSEEYAHGPIILAIVLWLIWLKKSFFLDNGQNKNLISGSLLLLVGAMFYIVGRSQDIYLFEVGSEIPLLLGVLLLVYGASVARHFWFPLLFLIFLIPLPGFIVDGLTGPLKQQVSVLAENILYQLNYPIARSGVMLSIGQYQLLVADACSGLNSMFSLSALGMFYAYFVQRTGWVHNSILLLSILPIAFFANVTRVVLLVLITYYFGDEVGQGFAHKMAGMVLFMAALLSLLALDSAIQFVRTRRLTAVKQ